MTLTAEPVTDRDHVEAATVLAQGGRAISAATVYMSKEITYDATMEESEQDAFTVGWTAGVLAVLAEVRGLVGPGSVLQLSGLSVPFMDALDEISHRFEVDQ